MRIYCLISFLFLVGFNPIAFSQHQQSLPKNLAFKHFTSADGLSQRSVSDIIQDQKGYLWFGTRDGLNNFDGHKFVVYRHSSVDSNSLSNSNIHSIYEDSYGNIWLGTERGLNKYNPTSDSFTRYRLSDVENTVEENVVRGIMQIDSSLLWVATANGIVQVDIHTHHISRIQKGNNHLHLPVDNNIRSFLKDNDGNIWICNTKYIDIYHTKKGFFKQLHYPQTAGESTHLNDLPTLFLDKKNIIWLGYEKGLARYDPLAEKFTDFYFADQKAVTTSVRTLCEDQSGNLWVGSYSGLYILSADRAELRHLVHDPNNETSLSQNSVYKILCDARGDMWIGTWADGVNYYNRDNGAFKQIPFGNTDNKLNYRVVSGMAEDADGKLWIGTEGGGLNVYDWKTKRFTYYTHQQNDPNSLSGNNVKAVVIDRKGGIWIGMHDGGLNYLDPRKKPFKFQQIDFPPHHNIALKAYKVLTLFEDHRGNIWIGTLTGGLIFYDTNAKVLSRIDKDIKTVMSITQTKNPDILLFGGNNGLETIHIQTKQKGTVQLKKTAQHQPPLYVNCVFVDDSNNYWVGTEGQGLHSYHPRENTTRSYGTENGLPNDIIYTILPESGGKIWVSTNHGISQIEVASNTIKNYNQSDGLQGNEFNYGSFLKTAKNEFFFGGTNGLTYFHPQDLRRNTFVPPLDITRMDVNNTFFKKITDAVRSVTLKHYQNSFSIDFTSLSYMRPDKNEFAYKLEGNDEHWNDIGNQRRAVYTNIKPGTYRFKVIGANNDGIWNEEGASITIRVRPAPWQTWWAYTLYAVLCGSLFLYIRKLILLRVKEKKEKERQEEINQLKLRVFTEISHELRTPLTLIISPLEKMVDEKQGDIRMQQRHDVMLKNARMMLQLINQILDFRKSESGKLNLQVTRNNIISFIEDVKRSFDELAEKKNIHYRFICRRDDIQVWFDRPKLKNVLFNLLSNAFKFSDGRRRITLYVSTSPKKSKGKFLPYVKISVVNFGAVIPKEQLPLIFDQFYQLDHPRKNLGSGLGLSLAKKLVEQHKGEILASSTKAKGTRFTVLLPLGHEHFASHEYAERDGYVVETDETPYVEEDSLPAPTSPENRQRLLIVEDNPDLQHFMIELFQHNYQALTAENGREALEIVCQHTVDLIISDVSMPDMDGFELCRQIKTTLITSHIPVILLTAKTAPIDQKKGYHIGADAYVTKPFNTDILKLQAGNLLKTRENLIRKFKNDLILEPKELTVTSPDEAFLAKAIALVEEHISNADFNVSAFIEQMNTSRTVIYTKLKALTGQNLTTFIRTIRLKKAAMLLSQTSMGISQVAYEVGFNDLKYFRESFKEYFQCTPSEYKRQQQRNPIAR